MHILVNVGVKKKKKIDQALRMTFIWKRTRMAGETYSINTLNTLGREYLRNGDKIGINGRKVNLD